jgi:Zn-dependent protease
MDNIQNLIQTVLVYALPVVFAITLQEAAQGYSAYYFGDKTAYSLGRLSLNPFKHIDPLGTIILPVLLYLGSGGKFLFGYAKPMPLRFDNMRKPKRDMIWVSLAAPASSLVQILLWGLGAIFLKLVHFEEQFFASMCQAGMLVNAGLFAFCLFPIPPLPGGRILAGLLPFKYANMLSKIERYAFFIVLAFAFTGLLATLWMRPLMYLALSTIGTLLAPLNSLLN